MSSFNAINGVPASANEFTLTKVLHLCKRELIRARRHAIDSIERADQRSHAGIDCSLERGKINLAQCVFREIGGVVVAASLRIPVSNPVFRTGEYFVSRAVVVALKPAHTCTRECGAEKRIFTRTFSDSSPTRIACD